MIPQRLKKGIEHCDEFKPSQVVDEIETLDRLKNEEDYPDYVRYHDNAWTR